MRTLRIVFLVLFAEGAMASAQPLHPYTRTILWSSVASTASAQQQAPNTQETLASREPPGTSSVLTEPNAPPLHASLILELTKKVTSKTAKPGDDVHFVVVEDVIQEGLVVIAKNTAVDGKVERVDKAAKWGTDAGLIVCIGPVKTVTGEEVPIAGTLGQKGEDPSKLTKSEIASVAVTPYVIMMPVILVLGPLEKGRDFVLPAGTRSLHSVTLPSPLDHGRLLAAQPKPGAPRGYATVYFVPHNFDVITDVWCGAVKVPLRKNLVKVLLPPGRYSCRAEKFSPLQFDVADGGTYYLLVARDPGFFHNKSGSVSVATAAEVVGQWNTWLHDHPSGGKVKDLTKVDPALMHQFNGSK